MPGTITLSPATNAAVAALAQVLFDALAVRTLRLRR